MTKGTRALLQSIIGIVIVSVTLIIFFVSLNDVKKMSIDYWALGFLIAAEITFISVILFVSLRKSSKNKLFLNIGMITTGTLYLIATLVCALLSRSMFGIKNISNFIIINTMIIALTIISIITIGIIGSKIHMRNNEQKENMTDIQEMEMMIDEIKNILFSREKNKEASNICSLINTLNEELIYSDKVSNASVAIINKDIKNKIMEISELVRKVEQENFDYKMACETANKAIHLIKQRNKVLAQSK